jgi:tRNA (mo5U34)-methyltransferase
MKNVRLLPTVALLLEWLEAAGYAEPRIADISATTGLEQRRTGWMTFESLADGLDPSDPNLTVEGWPAPRRAVVLCRKPS